MRKTLSIASAVMVVTGLIFFGALPQAEASTPTLSTYYSGGSSVQITVYGDPNSSVVLYYYENGYGYRSQYVGVTDYNGYFSTNIGSNYNISPSSSVYVTVNGQSSQSVSWPSNYNNYNNYYNNDYYSYGGSISLSQNNISVGVNQTTTVTISGGNKPYSMFPGSPNLYQTALSENTLTIIGRNSGSDSLKICSSNSNSSCATLYITVGGGSGYYNNQLSLSQTNLSLNVGDNGYVSIYNNGGYSGNYYISNNSNSNAISAYVNGSTLNIHANSSGNGNVSVCQSNGSQCATVYVTVSGGSNYSTGVISFSPTNPSLSIGQNTNVSIYGGSSSNYNLAYNSNTNLVQASVNGSTLNLYGSNTGSVAIVVCSSSNACGALTVTVGSVLGADTHWTYCASENGYCNFYGTQRVRYGANGSYYYRTLSNGVSCSNSVFGDPLFGVPKQCSYGGDY